MDQIKEKKLLQHIYQETKLGLLNWSEIGIDRYIRSDGEVIGKYYCADLKGKKILLYRYKYKHYIDEDEYHWQEDIMLEITDKHFKQECEIESDNTMISLYNSVRYKEANLDSFLFQLGI